MKLIPTRLALAGLLILPLAVSARAGLLTLDPLVNGDFESPDTPYAATGIDMNSNGWVAKPGKVRIRETDDGGTPEVGTADAAGAASQVGKIWVNSTDGSAWFYQALTGTSDANGANHTLTAAEAAGDTISVAGRLGIESQNGWPNAHGIMTIGLQNRNTWEWLDSRKYYTGTQAQAVAAGNPTVDGYLGLNETATYGSAVDWTWDANIPATGNLPANSTNPLIFSVNYTRVGANDQTVGLFDDFSATLVPEPSSATMLLTVFGLGLLVRRRH